MEVGCQFCGLRLPVANAIYIHPKGYFCTHRHVRMHEDTPKGNRYEEIKEGRSGFPQIVAVPRDSLPKGA